MANTPQGAKADADAKATAGSASVETSDSGVVVNRPGVTDYEPVDLYHRDGRTARATSLEREIALKFDGFRTEKPKSKS